jgi:hypothetical protein
MCDDGRRLLPITYSLLHQLRGCHGARIPAVWTYLDWLAVVSVCSNAVFPNRLSCYSASSSKQYRTLSDQGQTGFLDFSSSFRRRTTRYSDEPRTKTTYPGEIVVHCNQDPNKTFIPSTEAYTCIRTPVTSQFVGISSHGRVLRNGGSHT